MKEYQLNVDPRILELLGPNLYTNIYYVLAELIANAYDADAQNVYIIANKDDIRVEDDGHGMSYSSGEINKFLNVAAVSRENESESFTRSKNRRKMGRKGVGKLAALSVSENVDVLTIANGEKSGFILSRRPEEGNKLKAIPESAIGFTYIKDSGTAIVMKNPQYRLNKTLSSVKRNLLKIFPLVNSDFSVHIIRDDTIETIDKFDEAIMRELSTLITLGDEFSHLCDLVPDLFPSKRSELVSPRQKESVPVLMNDINGVEHEYQLKIGGWIGTYRSTRGRKAEVTDFPDNFISIFANKKLGEFNILPIVGQNKLNEVYVVGQVHVDLFELTELPDMALSNRQGYKSDDPRYQALLKYTRENLLADILRKREHFTELGKVKKKIEKDTSQRKDEERLRIEFEGFRSRTSEQAAENLAKLDTKLPPEVIKETILNSINDNSPDMGIKAVVDSQKKKILISQTLRDKPFADLVYAMLIYNNVPQEDILYTNCDDERCRVPEERKVYDYLRDFFVDSISTQKIFVIFVTSENTKASWGAITEIGAGWITKVGHTIFNIIPFRPEHPLDDESQWQSTSRDPDLWMIPLHADIFCQKIESICDRFGYKKNSRVDNRNYLETLVSVRNLPGTS